MPLKPSLSTYTPKFGQQHVIGIIFNKRSLMSLNQAPLRQLIEWRKNQWNRDQNQTRSHFQVKSAKKKTKEIELHPENVFSPTD